MIEIGALCELSDAACFRGVFLCIYSAFMCAAACYCLFRLRQHLRRFSFEMIPLSTCALQSLLHFLDLLFFMNYRVQILTCFIGLQTFLLVAQSFVHLHYKLVLSVSEYKQYFRQLVGGILVIYLLLIALMLTSLILISVQNCYAYFDAGLAIQFSLTTISSIISIVFGDKILKSLRAQAITDVKTKTRRQIHLVQLVLSTTSVLYILFYILQLSLFNDVLCEEKQKLSVADNMFMFFFTLLQMTPCLLVPIVYYYLPSLPEEKENDDFNLQEDALIEIQLESNPTNQDFDFLREFQG